jgi:glyceraldehyde-3-phosphate dehydrogenase/erythrose-4-phosphate dehydrogenase
MTVRVGINGFGRIGPISCAPLLKPAKDIEAVPSTTSDR